LIACSAMRSRLARLMTERDQMKSVSGLQVVTGKGKSCASFSDRKRYYPQLSTNKLICFKAVRERAHSTSSRGAKKYRA
jgi:hypothetical protein